MFRRTSVWLLSLTILFTKIGGVGPHADRLHLKLACCHMEHVGVGAGTVESGRLVRVSRSVVRLVTLGERTLPCRIRFGILPSLLAWQIAGSRREVPPPGSCCRHRECSEQRTWRAEQMTKARNLHLVAAADIKVACHAADVEEQQRLRRVLQGAVLTPRGTGQRKGK